jgi:hypothetical protein
MDLIAEIRTKVAESGFEMSKHAAVQSIARGISPREVHQAIAEAELIEDYPNDKYGPSCLLLGWTMKARPLHVQCTYPSRSVLKIITVYEPDSEIWIDFRQRRDRGR